MEQATGETASPNNDVLPADCRDVLVSTLTKVREKVIHRSVVRAQRRGRCLYALLIEPFAGVLSKCSGRQFRAVGVSVHFSKHTAHMLGTPFALRRQLPRVGNALRFLSRSLLRGTAVRMPMLIAPVGLPVRRTL